MKHIFVTQEQMTKPQTLRVTGENYHHIARVLRMKAGEELSVCISGDETGAEYRYGIEEITDDAVVCALRFVKRNTAEMPVRAILLQALPKSDKMDLIVEKAVELGASEIVPVQTARCVMRLDEKKAVSRVARWEKKAKAAAEQSRRGVEPVVSPVLSFRDALRYVKDADVKLLPYEMAGERARMTDTKRRMDGIKRGQSVAIFIGAEGGFTKEEVDAAAKEGFQVVTLGDRILRTETAGMTVLAWLNYALADQTDETTDGSILR